LDALPDLSVAVANAIAAFSRLPNNHHRSQHHSSHLFDAFSYPEWVDLLLRSFIVI
jgi:hypothetical protein